MKMWRRNLWFCWFGMFVTGIGMSQIAPILPIYINKLGVHNTGLIEQLSGLAFGITFVVSAIFSPIWGKAADKIGRKPMLLRASLGMSIIVGSMGFVSNVYELIGLRLLQGVITGFSTACTTLIATQTTNEEAGWALGILSTANIAGSLLGPTFGGFIGDTFGFRNVFFITGGLLFIAFITTLLFIKEDFVRNEKMEFSTKELWNTLPQRGLTLTMLLTAFVLSLSLYSIEPIITVYVSELCNHIKDVAVIAGVVFSASGLANIISAPRLGKLSNKVGVEKVILISLIIAGIIYIPQAFVKNPWQLMGLRFLLGLAFGGLTPAVNTLIKRITPNELTGRVFGFSISAQYLGTFGGSVLGGQISSFLGIRYVFFVTSGLLFLNALWVYFRVYKKINKSL
ncbi:multidrug efflux MFS transporter [Clostridium thermobutyricum]|uniref:multidrug efflux MFS transporter n=1 Tax=Clostridium thermobutyricum TaxID=29372 RepID=UPI0018AA8D07|nr:multidrug efflux MFS transporter [Clostridium thermobutyricum]